MRKESQRLDKYLAHHGVCSRRAVKDFVKDNLITINGKKTIEPGKRIEPDDTVLINDKPISHNQLVYYILNKPKGIISTASDEHNRANVVSHIKANIRIYPIGRLDKNTTGLLILTNDGELTNKLTHPRYHIEKVYRLTIQGYLSQVQKDGLRTGVLLSDYKTLPAGLTNINKKGKTTEFDLMIREGKNRQIKRMCEVLGIRLVSLKRIQIGPLRLENLKEGEYREFTQEELNMLKTHVERLATSV